MKPNQNQTKTKLILGRCILNLTDRMFFVSDEIISLLE